MLLPIQSSEESSEEEPAPKPVKKKNVKAVKKPAAKATPAPEDPFGGGGDPFGTSAPAPQQQQDADPFGDFAADFGAPVAQQQQGSGAGDGFGDFGSAGGGDDGGFGDFGSGGDGFGDFAAPAKKSAEASKSDISERFPALPLTHQSGNCAME